MHEDDMTKQPEEQQLPPFSGFTKLHRIIAYVIDLMITFFAEMIIWAIAAVSGIEADSSEMFWVELVMLIVTVFGFFLRDWLWNGRSLGKRIMGLVVLNKRTGEPPARWCLIVRNMFFWTLWIDLIVMLVSGRSIGDHMAHTVVIPKKVVLSWKDSLLKPPEEMLKADTVHTKKWIKRIGVGFLVFVLIALTGALIGLQVCKTTPEYEVAYTYFVESDTFAQLGVDESRVWLNAYSLRAGGGQQTAHVSFMVGLRQYGVVCHKTGAGEWAVCEECTTVT